MLKMFFFFILFAIITRPVVSQNDSKIEKFFKNIVSDHPEINFILLQIYLQLPQNECVDELQSIGTKILSLDIPAIKMLDASAKPQSGVLFGNIMHIGNFDECLELNAKYCTVPFSPHPEFGAGFNESLSSVFEDAKLPRKHFETDLRSSFGFCVPKICNASDLQPLSNAIEDAFELPTHFHFEERKCYTKEKVPLTSSANVAIIIFSIFAIVVVSSTLYDAFFHGREKKPSLNTAFSVISNLKKLFAKTSQEDIKCLNGLAVISMMWLLVLHRIIYSFSTPNINIKHIFYWRAYFVNAFVFTADMAVDTFLTINGLLVVYLFLKYRKKGVKFSIVKFYASKILRHMPSLAMAVLLATSLLKYMGNGPFWWTVEEAQDKCEQRWWATLFYIQNYFNPDPKEMCLTHSWYLAVDTHMYFLTPFILVPFIKWPKFTTITVLSLVFVSATYAFAISIYHDLPTTLVKLDFRIISYLYLPTHVRGVSYLVGMVCGYYLFETRNVSLKLQKVNEISTRGKPHQKFLLISLYLHHSSWQVLTSWIFSLLTLLGIIIGHFVASGVKLSSYESAIFNACIRVGWSLAVCIIVFLCRKGYGGVINSFLSHDVFTVLNRLNYNVYILHELTLILVSGQLRTPNYFSDLFAFHNFWGDYMFTLAMALVWNLAFESPMIALGKYFDLKM